MDRPDPATRWPLAYALVKMSRPSHLGLILLVYSLGVAIAAARGAVLVPLDLGAGAAALLFVSASVHYANEYADHETDRLTERTPFSGGSGALERTGVDRAVALLAAAVTFLAGLALAVGCLLHGFAVPAIGVLLIGGAFGWQYSLPPLALAWHGVGEVDNAALGGLVLPAYGFAVAAGDVTVDALLATLPFATVVFLNLLDTTWPDREADAAVGKDTLATRWPTGRLRALYAVGAAAAVGSLGLLAGWALPPLVAASGLVVVPLLVWGAVRYTRTRSPFPTVAAMVLLAVVQLAAWIVVAYR